MCKHDWGVLGSGFLSENGSGFAVGFAYDDRNVGFDDAGFFGRDLCVGVAQECGMVFGNVGDDTHHRGDDVGAVQSSAKPCLNNSNVDVLVGKMLKCHGHCQFKERRMAFKVHGLVSLHEVDNFVVRNHLAVDANSLAKVDEVGRCVKSHTVAGALQYGGNGVGR